MIDLILNDPKLNLIKGDTIKELSAQFEEEKKNAEKEKSI